MIDKSADFVFVLGRECELALAELGSVFRYRNLPHTITKIDGNLAFINLPEGFDSNAFEFINLLGGTIRIFKLLHSESKDIEGVLSGEILVNSRIYGSKFNFGISSYVGMSISEINKLGFTVKKRFKNRISLRFVELKKDTLLDTVSETNNRLATRGVEIGLFPGGLFGRLVAVNDPNPWSKRDYQKPRADKYSGMVPPKLARMLVSLALGQAIINYQLSISKAPNEQMTNDKVNGKSKMENGKFNNWVVVDPFCGSGNILMEAMVLGYPVLGSDISKKAVEDTNENLGWFSSRFAREGTYKIEQYDATSEEFGKYLETNVSNYNQIAIISEPFLGKPKRVKPNFDQARAEYAQVLDTYIKFLTRIGSLNCELSVCLVFPLIETAEGKCFSLYGECVDEIEKLGYTEVRIPGVHAGGLIYGRDYQVVKREIVLLRFTNS